MHGQTPDATVDQEDDEAAKTRTIIESECRMISLVQRESNIPLPHVYLFEADPYSSVGAQFILMGCLRGNAGIDLSINLPPEHKLDVYAQIAEIQLDLFHIRLPKIGKVAGINEDGTYRQGPLPILGGPFDTAAEFFRAWSTKVEFGLSEGQLRDTAGPYAEEISLSLSAFREWVNDNAKSLSVNNTGPFPLCHGDFGHNNMVFDDTYRLLGVIDWETAFAGPYEVSCEFPLSMSVVPPAMDVPWKYDEMGCPKDPDERQKFADRASYIAIVR
ncbi:hypothetical protein BDV37DRAFT_83891 [Aspergillus pseudonomiae]|uniref:Aminoglycoside phosphotransferase domain-containing protein n=1 Tax=Aspergillus pseudonomiae TaxID=1506151 RepID=A0A5N7DHE9_9EURO|nr:uncharacterized protein BDV37DRAFT_83891 [Aspergillus pseudonomiae]KAE8405866.1 hypothetical protein BDV37DRAFT_83891 [Aspergillus pseudonomiae]